MKFHTLINSIWYKEHPLRWCLLPLSLLYRFISSVRRAAYRFGLFKVYHLSVPIIVVGNITVGGTGKTPSVIALVEMLKAQGYHPGVISRGYGGKGAKFPKTVTADSSPHDDGDEAVLIAMRTGVPVVVDPNRVHAGQYLLEHYDCNIIISDDGLQHYALGRDFEIALIDGEHLFGNGLCLPAGPLREPLSRLNAVDVVLQNGGESEKYSVITLQSGCFTHLIHPQKQRTSKEFSREPIDAVAGIGHPDRFFNTLKHLGLTINEHAYPDHHAFARNDFTDLKNEIIMTEKDAVKCKLFATEKMWFLPVSFELPDELSADILQRIDKKRDKQ